MYQSGRAGDEAKKRKSPAKSGRVGIYAITYTNTMHANITKKVYLLAFLMKVVLCIVSLFLLRSTLCVGKGII